jgi:hypothetical protein
MLRLLFSILVSFYLLCAVAHAQTCGPDPVPGPAAAHGLTCEIFWDDFTSSSTFDLANTGAPGFKWYIRNVYGRVLNPSDLAFVAGGVQITPSTNTAQDLYNIASCVPTGTRGVYNGTAVGGGSLYVNIKISAIAPEVGGNLWWAALWMLGYRQIVGGWPVLPAPSPESDVLEHSGGHRNLHQWDILNEMGSQTDTFTPLANTPPFVNGTTYGTLILKPEDNGGTGTAVAYLNDELDAENTPVTWAPGGTYSVTSVMPMCILMTSGFTQSLVVRSVQVFAAPTAPSGGGGRRGWLR